MTTGFHPLVLAAIVGSLFAIVTLVVAWRASGTMARTLLLLTAALLSLPAGLALLVMHPEIFDARFRAYKAFYRDIRLGMTRDEVLALRDRHYPLTGPRRRPRIMRDETASLGFFMDTEGHAEPNCEGIFLSLADGRVRKAEYSAD